MPPGPLESLVSACSFHRLKPPRVAIHRLPPLAALMRNTAEEESLSILGAPANEARPVESQQAGVGSNPYVTIVGLCNGGRTRGENAVLHPPSHLRVWGDAYVGIDRP